MGLMFVRRDRLPNYWFPEGMECYVNKYSIDKVTVEAVINKSNLTPAPGLFVHDGVNYTHDGEFCYALDNCEWIPFNHETHNGNTTVV